MAFKGAGDLYGLFIKRNRFLSNSLSRTKDTRDECIRSLRHCPVPLVNWRCLLFVSCVCCWAFEIQSLSNQWSVHKLVVSSRLLNFNFLIFKIKWHRTWLSIFWNFIHSAVHSSWSKWSPHGKLESLTTKVWPNINVFGTTTTTRNPNVSFASCRGEIFDQSSWNN